MKRIGQFQSARWGIVDVFRGHYRAADGPTCIVMQRPNEEPLGVLSVNMYRPECSHDSRDLPQDCFYVKEWAENEELAREAFAAGLFALREDLGEARSGFVSAPVWQIREPA